MSQYKTKVWKEEFDSHIDVFRAIAVKEKLYHTLLHIWISKHPEFSWSYKIELDEKKVYLEVELTNDNSKDN